MAKRQVVHRIEDGTDRQQVAATTYQQRNFYTQMRDGFFSRNEIFNYVLHHQVARLAAKRKGAHVLDVCCGRGLVLPLLRYHAKIGSYTGIDIEPKNAVWLHQRVSNGLPADPATYYPWPTHFVQGNVAQADTLVAAKPEVPQQFDFIIYTASIEHMHPEDGLASLHALHRLCAPGGAMVLTCPNTPEDKDGYDTRYRAHVYEWKRSELHQALADVGWQVADEWTVDIGINDLHDYAENNDVGWVEHLRKHVPQEWIAPVLAPLVPPELAAELGLLCTTEQQLVLA